MTLPFVKMNGLGNDFVIVIVDDAPFDPTPAQARAIADRSGGIGCDQLILLGRSASAHAAMRIWNADGGEVAACGNAARCAAWLVMESLTLPRAELETPAGRLVAERAGQNIRIDMGPPRLDWWEIPLSREMDTAYVDMEFAPGLRQPGCVSMGNPHVVFFVPDVGAAPVTRQGPLIERHPLFPERVNVGFAQVEARHKLRLRVWERGVGPTRACGTGACAAVVAGVRQQRCDRTALVELDGGLLAIDWSSRDDHVRMTGPVVVEFTGRLPDLETVG